MYKNILVFIVVIIPVLFQYFGFGSVGEYFQIHFLDIGQGDSILLVTPDDKYILVDGGPDEKVIEQLGKVLPFWQRKLDYVIASHSDADHITGLVDVVSRYEVENFIYNGEQKNTLTYRKLMNVLEEKGVNINLASADNDFYIGCCVYIDVLWPLKDYDENLGSNDSSVAFIVSYKDFNVYLAGDLSSRYEVEMLNESKKVFEVEVQKVSHHGSRTSSSKELLEIIDPEISIISVGRDNSYGHPHREVLNIMEELHIPVYLTSELGNITILSDGKKYYMKI